MIPKLNSSLFEWTIWRNGSPIDIIGSHLRPASIAEIKPALLRYAIGYCDGTELLVRPKKGCKAVMFYKDGQHYWWHLYDSEFIEVFGS